MERHSLRIVIVLGILVTLLGGTGIFAVFTDRATTGTATITSGERTRAADLKVALADKSEDGSVNCDPDLNGMVEAFDDLVSPLFSATDVQPGQTANVTYLCLSNAGSGPLDATATVIDLTDLEDGCTGDEEAAGDTTCGAGDAGELSPLLLIDFDLLDCVGSGGSLSIITGYTEAPAAYAATPWHFTADPIEPGATACLRITSRYPAGVDEADAQQAQTDTVTWRLAFDVTAS